VLTLTLTLARNNRIQLTRQSPFFNTGFWTWSGIDHVGAFFRGLGCEGADGAFKNVTDENGHILPKVLNYRDVIGQMVGMTLTIPEQYVIHKGKYAVQFCRPGYDMQILAASNLYSYAFIFGPRPKYPNFSFTIDMQ